MTTYDDTIKALGGHYITDGDGTDYGAWTPNTVKTLIIANDSRPLEYASLEFSPHQITPSSQTARASLFEFHHLRSE